MERLTLLDEPAAQENAAAAQRLRRTMAAMRLSFCWWGVCKTFSAEQKAREATPLETAKIPVSHDNHEPSKRQQLRSGQQRGRREVTSFARRRRRQLRHAA